MTAPLAPHHVIVAEDEPVIRMLVAKILTDAGFVVIEAEHAEKTLAILASRAEGIHALFTDIQMPGPMDGLGLARHVRDRWPWIALLVASGKSRPGAVDMPSGTRFLPKPYPLHQVAAHVRELIGARPGHRDCRLAVAGPGRQG